MTNAEAPAAAKLDSKPSSRFRAAANVAMAIRRFQAALNPTYTYGKRNSGTDSGSAVAAGTGKNDAGATSSAPVDIAAAPKATGPSGTLSPTTTFAGTTPPKKVYDHHGHKGNLLLAPLPDVIPGEKA